MADDTTRDRVRALVRDVLSKAVGAETERTSSAAASPAPARAPSPPGNITRDESAKVVITEDDVRGLERGAILRVSESARLTPLAADIVNDLGIKIVRRIPRSGSKQHKTIAVGADHGGYPMKEELKRFLEELGHRVHDFGTNSESAVDYPDFAHAVARAVSEASVDLGIVIDGAGVGSAMTANKVPGVRAAACYSVEVARNSREHNDANVLTLGSKTITSDQMREIVRAWLGTEISEDRHRKRVAKIDAVERQYQR
ncbi:MAG TPA: ribose 5-phosphate isomerase B [Pyrinomonadaceae bacterium]|nr:ribose 5-phosphate isomerase B [Pyrinomonadaceae bacterium]